MDVPILVGGIGLGKIHHMEFVVGKTPKPVSHSLYVRVVPLAAYDYPIFGIAAGHRRSGDTYRTGAQYIDITLKGQISIGAIQRKHRNRISPGVHVQKIIPDDLDRPFGIKIPEGIASSGNIGADYTVGGI